MIFSIGRQEDLQGFSLSVLTVQLRRSLRAFWPVYRTNSLPSKVWHSSPHRVRVSSTQLITPSENSVLMNPTSQGRELAARLRVQRQTSKVQISDDPTTQFLVQFLDSKAKIIHLDLPSSKNTHTQNCSAMLFSLQVVRSLICS